MTPADPFAHNPLPERGRPAEEVLAALTEFQAGDRDWRSGRVFSLVYSAGDEVHALAERAMALYAAENGLNVLAFPSIGTLQHDLVCNTASLLGADDPASGGAVTGYLTSGGTESILQAVRTAREEGRARGIGRPQVVAPTSAHAAFTKAADWFDVDLVRVPVGPDYRADVDALAAAMTERTVLLIGSAPTYPHGVVDPIEELSRLALDRGVLLHVDACMGGYLLPFLERLGRFEQPYDFRVPGVTSMSADLHKYGYAPKGVSVVLYRTAELARRQVFTTRDWLGGFYASTAMAGTRSAAPIAAAWAVTMHLGQAGYLQLTEVAHDAALRLRSGIEGTGALVVRGDPPATVLAFGAADAGALDVFALGDLLSAQGWYLDRQEGGRHHEGGDSLHVTVHAGHVHSVDALVSDLAAAIEGARGRPAGDRSTTYGSSG